MDEVVRKKGEDKLLIDEAQVERQAVVKVNVRRIKCQEQKKR